MVVERLGFRVVEFMPFDLEEGVLYVSLEYMTALHRCCCGCGEKVVTPIGPTDWSVTFHGDSASLWPSIGNWGLSCRSHYILRRGEVVWAPSWSQTRIDAARRADHFAKEAQFEPPARPSGLSGPAPVDLPRKSRLWFIRHVRPPVGGGVNDHARSLHRRR